MKNINVLIVNYNTQFLTECCIKSINKNTPNVHVYVFDNSDKKPFVNIFNNVTVIDNTKGNIINFDEILSRYPHKTEYAKISGYGSAKHTITIDKCFDIINDNFILLDSDVLIRKDISELYDENCFYVGEVGRTDNVSNLRLFPFCCFLNVKKLKEQGIRYYSGNKICGLTEGSDKFDTGVSLYEDAHKFPNKNISINDYIVHYGSGSWKDLPTFKGIKISEDKWLEHYGDLWKDNLDIFICTHKDFKKIVSNSVYKVIDSRDIKDKICNLNDKELSEFFQLFYVAENFQLKDYVGFCHYRRYFSFLDNIPNVNEIFKNYDLIVKKPSLFNKTVKEFYEYYHSGEDLNILKNIIKEKYSDYYDVFEKYMSQKIFFGCNMFIMRKNDFLELIDFLKKVLKDLINIIGFDLEERIKNNKNLYLKNFYPNDTVEYQYRIYGYLLERLVGVFILKKFKKIKTVNYVLTEDKYKK